MCFILLRAIFLGSMKLILSGMVQWLVYCGMGGEGTITTALNGGDVKHGIYLHKQSCETKFYQQTMCNKI